ncbi:uncharacterized protein F4822DRAFT_409522 [Hypoxylon trugodes]|uniref:uncharacterized protein n=1 Tax=Hypoxylon trugodes TaxID=326681 RepID=UPI00219F8756|nr:uncharacterized protein F4822DRAFT_409522 [Hypoxylon trugodes]KAI1386277.1 hypothetical protein F4822DRAFT_409522 [Hypoxylon trugodes]
MPSFAELPAEVRLKIWNHALRLEACERFIRISEDWGATLHLWPLKQYVSPLLSTSYESRHAAKAFYDIQLELRERIQLPERIESPITGTVYASSRWDTFLLPWGLGRASQIVDETPHYRTEDINPTVAAKIRNIAITPPNHNYVGPDEPHLEVPRKCTPCVKARFWKANILPNITNYLNVRLTDDEAREFAYDLITTGGRGSYKFEQWVVYLPWDCQDHPPLNAPPTQRDKQTISTKVEI